MKYKPSLAFPIWQINLKLNCTNCVHRTFLTRFPLLRLTGILVCFSFHFGVLIILMMCLHLRFIHNTIRSKCAVSSCILHFPKEIQFIKSRSITTFLPAFVNAWIRLNGIKISGKVLLLRNAYALEECVRTKAKSLKWFIRVWFASRWLPNFDGNILIKPK